MEEQIQPKWNVERVHKEINEAKTKLFVVAKVLESGNIKFSEFPEWALVIRPLLKDIVTHSHAIEEIVNSEDKK
jgi:hypothetical protein